MLVNIEYKKLPSRSEKVPDSMHVRKVGDGESVVQELFDGDKHRKEVDCSSGGFVLNDSVKVLP